MESQRGNGLEDLIGCRKDNPFVRSQLEKDGIDLKRAEIKRYNPNSELYNLYEDGISICFVEDKVYSIDLFRKDTKFKTVKESLLKNGIRMNFTGRDFVEKFGEPLEKGGGIFKKMDIWLRFANLQVELDDRSWETAQDSNWKSLTLF